MEAVVINAGLFEELEKDMGSLLSVLHGIAPVVPRHLSGPGAKGVAQGISHAVPIGCSKTKVFSHRLALHELVGVIVLEG